MYIHVYIYVYIYIRAIVVPEVCRPGQRRGGHVQKRDEDEPAGLLPCDIVGVV